MKTNFQIFNGPITERWNGPKGSISIHNQDSGLPTEILMYGIFGDTWDESGIIDKKFAELLNGIPKGTKINLRINSVGGSVKDGLGIYNRLQERRADVTAIIDGYACSTASWVALAANKVIIPENGAMMIHNPATAAWGTAEDMRKAAAVLDQHKQMIVSMYRTKTGKTDEEIGKAMNEETWFIGAQAKEWGLADEVKDSVEIQNSFDFSTFRRVPGVIAEKLKNSAAKNGGANNPQQTNTHMKREQIIALLKKHGATVDNAATDEQLLAQLETVMNGLADKAKTPAAPTNSGDDLKKIQDDITNLKKQREDERRAFVAQKVDNLIAEGKVNASERDAEIDICVTNDKRLELLAKREVQKPGAEPVSNIGEISAEASVDDIGKHINRLSTEAVNSMLRGNEVSPKMLALNAQKAAIVYNKHRNRLLLVSNANSISSDLKRNVILQEVMRAFAEQLMPLRAFSTVFANVPLDGTNKIAVPYYPLETTDSTDYNADNGYVMDDSDIEDKDVTVNKRKYQPVRFSSSELARIPAINLTKVAEIKAEKLAADVFEDVLSVVTVANYGAAAFTGSASGFDSNDIADLKGVCDTAKWSKAGRSLILSSAYDVNLLKDSSVKHAFNFGSNEPIVEGRIPRISGFDYYSSTVIPTNSENLVGMCVLPSAMLVATSPVMPDEEVRKQLSRYQLVVHPQLGIAFEYRCWGNPDYDQRREVIECNYGYNAGETAALKRLASA